jgi:SAM-dependent MidA family methyltransferase
MTFARFMELALYHPEVGYYRQARARVGYGDQTDFFTASTSGAVFGELVSAASAKLLRAAGRDPHLHAFVEIGAEPGHSVLQGVSSPFAEARTLRLGEPLAFSGDCVVFSNELFDAQPCTRVVFRRGRWWEIGVGLAADVLVEVLLPCERDWHGREDYHVDEPRAAANLAATLAALPWRGLFLAFDYGKMLAELLESTPAGTARAYYRHAQSNDLLARPGEQDLTCHVCWDWLIAALRQHGFAEPRLESQETFLVRHAGDYIATASAADARHFAPRKLALLQLLHPAHLGQKFQVLHALR